MLGSSIQGIHEYSAWIPWILWLLHWILRLNTLIKLTPLNTLFFCFSGFFWHFLCILFGGNDFADSIMLSSSADGRRAQSWECTSVTKVICHIWLLLLHDFYHKQISTVGFNNTNKLMELDGFSSGSLTWWVSWLDGFPSDHKKAEGRPDFEQPQRKVSCPGMRENMIENYTDWWACGGSGNFLPSFLSFPFPSGAAAHTNVAAALTVMSSDPPRSQPTFHTGAASRQCSAFYSPLCNSCLIKKVVPKTKGWQD